MRPASCTALRYLRAIVLDKGARRMPSIPGWRAETNASTVGGRSAGLPIAVGDVDGVEVARRGGSGRPFRGGCGRRPRDTACVQPSSWTAASAAARTLSGSEPTISVLAVGLVPHGDDVDARSAAMRTRAELRFGLVRETVADADRVFRENEFVHRAEATILTGASPIQRAARDENPKAGKNER